MTSKWQKKIVIRARKKELGDWRRNESQESEPRCSHYPPGKIDEYETEEQLAKQRMVVLGNDHILAFGKVFETLLTILNSFSIHFAIHLKSIHAMPTNSNGHVSVQRSLRCM